MFKVEQENIFFDRDNSDYLYNVDDLIHLKGKKYHSKRNHIHKFTKTYEYSYEDIDRNNIDCCYKILEEWCYRKNCAGNKVYKCEKKSNVDLLKNYEDLDCTGMLIKVNGKYEAFTVGERLNSNTAVVHIKRQILI